jgi:hypothetical protein
MRVAAVLALFVLGCASEPDEPPDWHGDERFTAAERVEIQRGANWLHGHAGLPTPRIEWSSAAATHPRSIRRERAAQASGACVDGTTVYIDTNDPNVRPVDVAGLAAHELAHCVLGFVDGYRESERRTDGIMRVITPMAWTADEQAQCREHADRCPSGL